MIAIFSRSSEQAADPGLMPGIPNIGGVS
jgi:hypothetical protein